MIGDPQRAMMMYAQLASIASHKKQPLGRDRFLILAGVAAMRAGWPHVGEHCHRRITALAPHHLLSRYPSLSEALRDEDFAPFVRRIERFCPPERAEHLLSLMGTALPIPDENRSAGEIALTLLQDI